MKRFFLFLFLCVNFYVGFAQKLEWAMQFGAQLNTTYDLEGNIYLYGKTYNTLDFDFGPNVETKTPGIYVAKYDSNLNVQWVNQITCEPTNNTGACGMQSCSISSLQFDSQNNCYLSGSFAGNVDFNPGVGKDSLLKCNLYYDSFDGFLCKWDMNGNFVWVKNMNDESISIIQMTDDHIYLKIRADYYAGQHTVQDVFFVAKFNLNGDEIWKKTFSCPVHISGEAIYFTSSNIVLDRNENLYISCTFVGPSCFAIDTTFTPPNIGFILKLDSLGNKLWVKEHQSNIKQMAFDQFSNSILLYGTFQDSLDIDLSSTTTNIYTSNIGWDTFISKYDTSGQYLLHKQMGGDNIRIFIDSIGNIFTLINFVGTEDFDPGPNLFELTAVGQLDICISKLNHLGDFKWNFWFGGTGIESSSNIFLIKDRIYSYGSFQNQIDFDPSAVNYSLNSIFGNYYFIKIQDENNSQVRGNVFLDLNENCIQDSLEINNISLPVTINPGNIQTLAYHHYWTVDSLPPGTYTATVDTSGPWKATCSPTVSFTVVHPDSFVQVTPIGIKNTTPCAKPEISIYAPFLRRCLSNQNIYVQATNSSLATGVLYNAYADITLDPFLTVDSASRSYISLGNNVYRFQLDSLYPNQSKFWTISTTVSCSTVLGQTLCMDAKIFPISPCMLDTLPNPVIGVSACNGAWDQSSLVVNGICLGDSIKFVISNQGNDMDCFMPVRMFANGVLNSLDSLKIVGGDSLVIMIPADGRTWRLEADQHPLHPGNSHPNTTIDACGDSTQLAQNWTPGMVNNMPLDDADPVIDIYCGQVSGSFDPNDKTGYPTGVTNNHYILKNQQLQYVIRFQNTGTDTAFTVVIRDTLDTDLDIFSVKSGVSSHNYTFRMYGPRVLEWTFNNIMLPDSFVNEPNSHGFVTFTVEQNENLPNGTLIENSAGIYFDFNDPVITNISHHEINEEHFLTPVSVDPIVQQTPQIQLFPNPTEDKIFVVSSIPTSIKLLDLTGRVLQTLPNLKTSHELNLSEYPAGIYLIEANVNGKIEVKKVIKR